MNGFKSLRFIYAVFGIAVLWFCASARAASSMPGQLVPREQIVHNAAVAGEHIWRAAEQTAPTLSSRDLFSYALALCEAKTNLNRLDRLFVLAATMQDRNAQSPGYGNFRWSWRDEKVLDYNAVDFCMQGGALLWRLHHNSMPLDVQQRLKEVLEHAGQGLLNHHVRESYTNIALMNAGDLILLGEAMEKPEWVEEGYTRLDRIILYMSEAGTHEYCSPTYYGTDLDDLVLIEAFAQREEGRAQARALLEYFWTDLALNWYAPAQKLGGTRSRDYDYLRGLGSLDQHMMANGWLPVTPKEQVNSIWPAFAKWYPPAALWELCSTRFPRLVTQSWGTEPGQTRTHYICRDITLSASGHGYGGGMDLPLTVDFPGDRNNVRCYFISDARLDPYGLMKIPAGGGHEKTLHLNPFWTAAQRRTDALGLVLYRDKDIVGNSASLDSTFVMPMHIDGIWVGEKKVNLIARSATTLELPANEALVLRQGTAAMGLRVPWTRDLAGKPASISFVYDANRVGAMRLSVSHAIAGTNFVAHPGAAFWIRIGSDLKDDNAFEAWRQHFTTALAQVDASTNSIRLSVAGEDGPVMVSAKAPFAEPSLSDPPASKTLLALNGDDLGLRILGQVEPVKTSVAARGNTRTLSVSPGTPLYWEAESGRVLPLMTIGRDAEASGGAYVWAPGKEGEPGKTAWGDTTWQFNVSAKSSYYIWGRVLSPTPSNDSFSFRLSTAEGDLIPTATWALGVHTRWQWVRLKPDSKSKTDAIELPAGLVNFQLMPRENGARIDRLFLTSDARQQP